MKYFAFHKFKGLIVEPQVGVKNYLFFSAISILVQKMRKVGEVRIIAK